MTTTMTMAERGQPGTQEDDQKNRMTLTNCSATKKRGDDVLNNGGL